MRNQSYMRNHYVFKCHQIRSAFTRWLFHSYERKQLLVLSFFFLSKVKHIGMLYWFPPVVQLLYAGFVSYPCWPLCACQHEGLLTSFCAYILINTPTLISLAEVEEIDLSNPAGRTHSRGANNHSDACWQWRMIIYLFYSKIKQLTRTIAFLIWHPLHI